MGGEKEKGKKKRFQTQFVCITLSPRSLGEGGSTQRCTLQKPRTDTTASGYGGRTSGRQAEFSTLIGRKGRLASPPIVIETLVSPVYSGKVGLGRAGG